MDRLFSMAEKEMFLLHNPYVGTEHFFLAYLKEYSCDSISYEEFKSYIIEIIGSSYRISEYVLYTPILRYVKNNIDNVKDAIVYILSNDDSIAFNILVSKNINCKKIIDNILNNKSLC